MTEEKYTLTLFETCEKLNRSRRAISRYIRVGLLHPIEVKSRQGTKEYRFDPDDVEVFRAKNNMRQEEMRRDKTNETRQDTDLDVPPPPQPHVSESSGGDETGSDKKRQEETGQKASRGKVVSIEDPENIDFAGEIGRDEKRHNSGDETRKDETNSIVGLLKETVSTFKIQLEVKDQQISAKDEQISKLIERNREMNILVGTLQQKVLMIEGPQAKPAKNSRKIPKPEEPEIVEFEAEAIAIEKTLADDKHPAPDEKSREETKLPKPIRNNRKPKTDLSEGEGEKTAEPQEKKGFWKSLWG